MAKVYAVKDGSYPQNFIDLGRRVPLDALERRIQDWDLRSLGPMPPEFNPAQPSHAARHVVVELEMDEPPGQCLTQTGYYTSSGMTWWRAMWATCQGSQMRRRTVSIRYCNAMCDATV
jgi:hypothetical protein